MSKKNFISLLLVYLLGVHPTEGSSPRSESWDELKGCTYIKSRDNDGDSFYVKYKDKIFVFRLYLIDTPETNLNNIEQNMAQCREFKSSLKEMLVGGFLAKKVTAHYLDQPFTVLTKWESAAGRSKLPRSYAFITTGCGKDLGGSLISAGLARLQEREFSEYITKIKKAYLEDLTRAQQKKIGLWGQNIHESPEANKNDKLLIEVLLAVGRQMDSQKKLWESLEMSYDREILYGKEGDTKSIPPHTN